MIREALQKILGGRDLEEKEAAAVMAEIMEGRTAPAVTAAYLVALRCKGETIGEIAGSVQCMREHAVPVEISCDAVDLCGTGGDGKGTFNISTTCAFVVAGAGVPVAKHGNRAASSNCGSADLLEELGVAIGLPAAEVARCIEEVGVGFMFAPLFHPAMKHVAPVRRELGIRTIFNILGPLSNPAGVRRQLVGVFDSELLGKFAHTLHELGAESAIAVHSENGYDEATTTDTCRAAVLRAGEVASLTVEPEGLGFEKAQPEDLKGGTPAENARITMKILEGEESPRADTVLLNSGLALYAAGKTDSIEDGVGLARESIASRSAKKALDRLIELSQALSKEVQ
jgi:anthranilate phosphoribosyltransferase